MQDIVDSPFEGYLIYTTFAVFVKEADVERLDKIIDSISKEEYEEKQRQLEFIWQRSENKLAAALFSSSDMELTSALLVYYPDSFIPHTSWTQSICLSRNQCGLS